MSSSSSPPVVPPHCLNVPVLYELLKGEEEPCRMWLRAEVSHIADPLIDSLFHGLIMSSSSSSGIPQTRLTVSDLCKLLEGEKVVTGKVLKGEMDRLLNALFERLTNKLRTNTDLDRSEDGGDRTQMMDTLDQVESANPQSHQPSSLIPQPSTSSFNPVPQQHSNGDEVQLNTVEMIHIKEEHLDEQSHNEHHQQMDSDDADTNAHNVTVNIKTEPMECDFVVVKEEIKEEDDHDDDCDGCDRCLVKPKFERDDDDGLDNEDTLTNQVTIKTEWDDEEVKEEIKEEIKEEYEDDHDDECDGCERCLVKKEEVSDDDEVDNEGGLIRGGDNDEVDDERYEVTQPNVDCGQLLSNPSRDRKNDSNANESIEEGGTNLSSQQLLNTANQSVDPTVTQSGGELFSPSTSTGRRSNRAALNQQATASTDRNATKRKQPPSNRSVKRSKKTLQNNDGEDSEDIVNEDREESKVKILNLNCTQSNCTAKLDSLVHLHDHLSTVHRLSPLQCFATNCNARFDNSTQISVHTQLHHSSSTRFICSVCQREYGSQHKTYLHWYNNHLTGKFQCNFVSDCAQVTDTRRKMTTHQKAKHYSLCNHFQCTHPGCTASFAFKDRLKRHELIHLNTNQFHCNWPKCSHRTNRRSSLITHIRMCHFGLPQSQKAQKEKNIVDLRDPNEYVRVVVDE